jgi:hypothetical protein
VVADQHGERRRDEQAEEDRQQADPDPARQQVHLLRHAERVGDVLVRGAERRRVERGRDVEDGDDHQQRRADPAPAGPGRPPVREVQQEQRRDQVEHHPGAGRQRELDRGGPGVDLVAQIAGLRPDREQPGQDQQQADDVVRLVEGDEHAECHRGRGDQRDDDERDRRAGLAELDGEDGADHRHRRDHGRGDAGGDEGGDPHERHADRV